MQDVLRFIARRGAFTEAALEQDLVMLHVNALAAIALLKKRGLLVNVGWCTLPFGGAKRVFALSAAGWRTAVWYLKVEHIWEVFGIQLTQQMLPLLDAIQRRPYACLTSPEWGTKMKGSTRCTYATASKLCCDLQGDMLKVTSLPVTYRQKTVNQPHYQLLWNVGTFDRFMQIVKAKDASFLRPTKRRSAVRQWVK